MASLREMSWPAVILFLYGLFGMVLTSSAQEDAFIEFSNQTRSVLSADTVNNKNRTIEIVGASYEQSNDVKRVALVVGNGGYEKILKLENPINDASDVCEELRSLQFEVICMHDIRSRREFRDVVRLFVSKLGLRSVAVFYYAGHGIQLNGENYLLPTSVDARSSADIEDDGLSLSYLLRSLEDARSAPNIVVLDACRNNPFPQLKFGSVAKGLARIEPPIGTMLVYATAPNGVALDGNGRNGIFTKHFIKNIREPGLKIDELFQVVANHVQEDARKFGIEQVPYRSSSYSGAYCLAGCENPLVAAEIEQIRLQKEEATRKIQELSAENLKLKRQATEKSSIINDLEGKIAALPRAAPTGVQSATLRAEMVRLQMALSVARAEQADLDRLRKSVAEREEKISDLKSQILALQNKSEELEEYRRQLYALQRQSDEAAERMQLLAEENSRLKRLADKRNENVVTLEARIDQLSREVNKSGEQRSSAQEELAQLKASLDAARAQQKDLGILKGITADRELEIADLKNQLSELHKKSQQLEASRQQIMALQKENAEKTLLLNERHNSPRNVRPVLVPSF